MLASFTIEHGKLLVGCAIRNWRFKTRDVRFKTRDVQLFHASYSAEYQVRLFSAFCLESKTKNGKSAKIALVHG